MAQVHDARGWWLRDAGANELIPAPALSGDARADLVIVGGGYAGMWTAWEARARGMSVVLLEADLCGHGPSGRNGGFVDALWHAAPRLRERYGDAAARALGRASGESVHAIGAWCATQGIDAGYRLAGQLVASAAPAQDGVGGDVALACAELGVAEEAVPLRADEVRARCASPVLRSGVLLRTAATVQPARLALGLRASVIGAGVCVHEHTRAVRVLERPGCVEVTTGGGGVVRARAAVLAAGSALRSLGPLRDRLTVVSSHLVITEPVPDVLERIGWTGGECITDGRALVHYFRTTPDGRIAFGWGGGWIRAGARTGGRAECDPRVVAAVERDLVRFFPDLAGRVAHAWGGPIDASPEHLPAIVSLPGGRAWAVVGFTGNGVGPSHLAGRVLGRLVCDVRDELTALPIIDPPRRRLPPDPLRWLGGNAIRAALDVAERAQERGARAPAPVRLVADLPARMGVHIGR